MNLSAKIIQSVVRRLIRLFEQRQVDSETFTITACHRAFGMILEPVGEVLRVST